VTYKDTRFLLASKVSESRDANGGIIAFQKAIRNANQNLPNAVNTDAHGSYRKGLAKTVPNVEHMANR
jgi:hypothetical protein